MQLTVRPVMILLYPSYLINILKLSTYFSTYH